MGGVQMRTDDLDAVKEKLYSESEPFLAAHPNYDLSKLPSWVVENIEVARVYGNSKKGIILPDGRKQRVDIFYKLCFFHSLSYQRERILRSPYKEDTPHSQTASTHARFNSVFHKRKRTGI